jgi:L-threonylcarbamoyladenylate synthase
MHVSPTTAQHVEADLKGRVPLILDGGASTVGVESTILDMSSELPTILRPGGVSLEALRVLLPLVQPPRARSLANPDLAHEVEAQKSPGQMLIHYAPRVPAFLFEGASMSMRHAMLLELQRLQRQGKTVGVLIADEDVAYFQSSGASMYVLGSEEDSTKVASRLFAGLRTLEDAGVDVILCRAFPETGLGLAIRDRLLKATGGKLIPC